MNDNEKKKDEIIEDVKEEINETGDKAELEGENTSLSLEETEQKEEVVEPVIEPMETIVEVNTTYDYKTLKYCNMYVIRVKRRSRLVYSIMSAICFIVGILCVIFMDSPNRYISILIIVLGLWTLFNLFTEENKIDKSLETYFKTHAPFNQRFAFNHEKIRVYAIVNGEEKTGDYPWAYIQEIHAIPEYFFLFLNGGTPIIIDRDPSKLTVGTSEDLEQIIKEQSALKPFNQYTGKLVSKLKDIKYAVPAEEMSTAEVVKYEEDNEPEKGPDTDSIDE